MGLSGISPWSLLLILLIILLLFGTKRLKGIGRDLGSAMRSLKQGLENDDEGEKNSYKNVANENDDNDKSKKD